MAAPIIYQLVFRTPFHIGGRGVGLETTGVHVPADTLFSALCIAWRELYGADSLLQNLLEPFRAAGQGALPFLLSSAFPFGGPVRLFPRPRGPFRALTVPHGQEKAFKR